MLALLLFGPRQLPQIGKSIGRALAEFRGATHEFKSSLEREVELDEERAQVLPQPERAGAIQSRIRLIKQQQFRRRSNGSCDGYAFLLAAG